MLPCTGLCWLLQVKEDVLPFCQYDATSRLFQLPEGVWQRRAVVCTCGGAGKPQLAILRCLAAGHSFGAWMKLLPPCDPTLYLVLTLLPLQRCSGRACLRAAPAPSPTFSLMKPGRSLKCAHCPECVPAAGIGMGPAAASSAGCAPCPVQSGSAHPPPLPACVPAWLQALLPEALIPLALLAPPPASIGAPPASWGAVLCGDPRQLGPVVRSQVGGWCS